MNSTHSCMLSVSNLSKFRDPPGTFCKVARRRSAPRKCSPVIWSGCLRDRRGGSRVRGVNAPLTLGRAEEMAGLRLSGSSSFGGDGDDDDEAEWISSSWTGGGGGMGERVKYMTLAREPPIYVPSSQPGRHLADAMRGQSLDETYIHCNMRYGLGMIREVYSTTVSSLRNPGS